MAFRSLAAALALIGTSGAQDVCASLEPCPVQKPESWGAVDLSSYQTQWDRERAGVPPLTAMCKGGTKQFPCRAGLSFAGKRAIIDTDFSNEVDDWPAVAWALLSSVGEAPQIKIESIVAAPFTFRWRFAPLARAAALGESATDESEAGTPLTEAQKSFVAKNALGIQRLKDVGAGPATMIERDNHAIWCPARGMLESHAALERFVALFARAKDAGMSPAVAEVAKTPVYRGQVDLITGGDLSRLKASEGVQEIIAKGKASSVEDPLFVVSIGAPTNVAAALLLAPEIVGKIVVLWDAAWGLENRFEVQNSFNFAQDLVAVRVLFESGVRQLYFPGFPSGQALQLSFPDMNAWYKGQGAVSDAIYQRYVNNPDLATDGNGVGRYNNVGTTRIMWDSGNLVPFILPGLLTVTHVVPPKIVQARTVPPGENGGCDGYETIGHSCWAYFPGNTTEKYLCAVLDPNDLTSCLDPWFVDDPSAAARPILQTVLMGGLMAQGAGASLDLLKKLQAAGL